MAGASPPRLAKLTPPRTARAILRPRLFEAIDRALEVPLAEELYRGLMGCLLNVGRHNEALRAFRRCKEMLSVVLGLKPSAATESLVREIYRSQT